MEVRTITALPVTDPSQVAQARRVATGLARELHFSEAEVGKLAIMTTELATNLVKHAGGGELVFNSVHDHGGNAVQVISLDRGPGMSNPAQSIRDGYSTAGSAGTGLGAVVRLSSVFDIHSVPGLGSVILAALWSPPRNTRATREFEVGSIALPKRGEEVSGDAWGLRRTPGGLWICLADGLGHGADAAEASLRALKVFYSTTASAAAAMLEQMHDELRPTRGAAVAVMAIDLVRRSMRFAGVGNISATVFGPERDHHMVSYNGVLGHEVRKIQEFVYPWPQRAVLVAHSDGLSQRADVRASSGLIARHPATIAGVLFRDFRRLTDDVTIVVVRDTGSGGVL